MSLFGPLSILVLLGVWAVVLIVGFALLHWAIGTPLGGQAGIPGLGTYAYFSGVTFFTLGYGDVIPTASAGTVPGRCRDRVSALPSWPW